MRGDKWRLLLASSPNSPPLSCWNGTGKKKTKNKKHVYITHLYLTALNFSISCWKLFVLYPVCPFSTQTQTFWPRAHEPSPSWLIDGMYQSPWLSLLKPLSHLSVKPVGFTWRVRRCYVSRNQWAVWIWGWAANNSSTGKETEARTP